MLKIKALIANYITHMDSTVYSVELLQLFKENIYSGD